MGMLLVPAPARAPLHPMLRPASEYRPYTPDQVLRRSEGSEAVWFEFGKSNLLRTVMTHAGERDNMPSLDSVVAVTRRVLTDETITPVKIQIVGFASIDGGRWGNERLALRRAEAVRDYVKGRTHAPDGLFEVVSGGEAWSELRDELVELHESGTGYLTEAEYRQVLAILDGVRDPDDREIRLKEAAGGAIYQKLLRGFFFDQRSAVYVRIYYEEAAEPDNNNNKTNNE